MGIDVESASGTRGHTFSVNIPEVNDRTSKNSPSRLLCQPGSQTIRMEDMMARENLQTGRISRIFPSLSVQHHFNIVHVQI